MSKRDFFCKEVFICLSVIVFASLLFFVPSAEVTASPKDKAIETKDTPPLENKGRSGTVKDKAIQTRFAFFDLTALDKETGYMWTRDANIAREWMNWDDAFKFVESLNKKKYAGYSNWRLPSEEELKTLADFAKGQGYTKDIDKYFKKIGFKNVQSYSYWSSTTDAYDATDAWIVSMLSGRMTYDLETDTYYVWPVCSGQ